MRPTEKMTAPDEATAVADRLHSTAIHLLRRLRATDRASGVGTARLSALSVLVFGGPCTLGELAAAEQVRAPTMTRIVAGLERQGLARRIPDDNDRRVVRVRATARGTQVLHQARARRVAVLAERIRELRPDERAQITAAASSLADLLRDWRRKAELSA